MLKDDKQHQYKDKNTGNIITYLDSDTLYENHPNGDYYIIGETSVKKRDKKGAEKKVVGENQVVYIYPLGTFKENNCTVVGYISCGNNEYIKVFKSRLPKFIFPLLLTVLLILGLMAGYFLNANKDLDIDPNIKDFESTLKRPKNIDSSKILIPGYKTMQVKKGTNESDIVLFNPEDNPCFFKFLIVEKATGDVLYESKLVPPGKAIKSIKLTKMFHKVGKYDVLLKFRTVDLENKNINYNGSDVEMELDVYE